MAFCTETWWEVLNRRHDGDEEPSVPLCLMVKGLPKIPIPLSQ